MNEKLIEEIAWKYMPLIVDAVRAGGGVYARAKEMLREYAAQNAAGQAVVAAESCGAESPTVEPVPAAPTERRSGKERRQDTDEADMWDGEDCRRTGLDRRQTPQPSTATASSGDSQESLRQGGIAGDDVASGGTSLADLQIDALWRSAVGQCVVPTTYLDGTPAGQCNKLYVSKDRYDSVIAPAIQALRARIEALVQEIERLKEHALKYVLPYEDSTPEETELFVEDLLRRHGEHHAAIHLYPCSLMRIKEAMRSLRQQLHVMKKRAESAEANEDKLTRRLQYYENALCFPTSMPYAVSGEDSVKTIEPIRIATLLQRLDEAEARLREGK